MVKSAISGGGGGMANGITWRLARQRQRWQPSRMARGGGGQKANISSAAHIEAQCSSMKALNEMAARTQWRWRGAARRKRRGSRRGSAKNIGAANI